MATKKVCDRCGREEMATSTDIRAVEVDVAAKGVDDEIFIAKDLCGSCVRELKEFLKPLPVQR